MGAGSPLVTPRDTGAERFVFAHPGRSIRRFAIPRRNNSRIRARRSRARTRHHSGQHQSSRIRADDHRPQFPGKDQRQHRQQRRGVVDRGRSRKDALGHQMGRRHGDGSFHRQKHSRHPGMDHSQFARPDRHRADLSGAGKSRRPGRGTDLGYISRHPHRTGGAGGRLLHRPRRGTIKIHPDDGPARHRHRLARRLDHGQVVPRPSSGKFSLHPLGRNLRDHGRLRRQLFHRRRSAAGFNRGRERRSAVRRTCTPKAS